MVRANAEKRVEGIAVTHAILPLLVDTYVIQLCSCSIGILESPQFTTLFLQAGVNCLEISLLKEVKQLFAITVCHSVVCEFSIFFADLCIEVPHDK